MSPDIIYINRILLLFVIVPCVEDAEQSTGSIPWSRYCGRYKNDEQA